MKKNYQNIDITDQQKRMESEKAQFIYLIREREFIRLNEQTYKLGKTKQEPNARLNGYPKNSEIVLFIEVRDCDRFEKILLNSFKQKFKQKKEYGREYFEGDKEEMVIEILIKFKEQVGSVSVNNSIIDCEYKCQYCGYCFTNNSHLKRHIKGKICEPLKELDSKKLIREMAQKMIILEKEISQLKENPLQLEKIEEQIAHSNEQIVQNNKQIAELKEKPTNVINNNLQII
jgi:hypothetical protein